MTEMDSCYAYTQANVPSIELVQMSQRMNIKDRQEDWTGKSDTALRRKLQNRLNQRASRACISLFSASATRMNSLKNATRLNDSIC
jgi:uncharacterized lipoprotein YmbA